MVIDRLARTAHRVQVLLVLLITLVILPVLSGPVQVSADASPAMVPAAAPTTTPHTFYGEYRTVEEIEQFLRDMAAAYPHLAVLEDIGDSWERQQPGGAPGYDLWALRLTNHTTESASPRPVFFLVAAMHAREIVPTEVASRFISYLLTSYGTDPDVTWLLNEHEIVVVPLLNPDGYKLVEQGYLQRKNTNSSGGEACATPPQPGNQAGVDLNRNFPFQWGGAGASSNPCHETFHGSAPASEPETQALMAYLQRLYPDRPRPADGAPVPADTSGVLISLHSYSDLVIWPWSHANIPAPDEAALTMLGEQLAARNGYESSQSVSLYPSSGTTSDWTYGELGIASYVIEIGPSPLVNCGGFTPPYACLDGGENGSFWPRNLQALLYAARVTRAPYQQPAGPDITLSEIEVSADAAQFLVRLQFSGGREPLAAAELYIAASPSAGGIPIALQSLKRTPGATAQTWSATIPLDTLRASCVDAPAATCLPTSAGDLPLLLVRGQNTAGAWGPPRAFWPQTQLSLAVPLVVR